MTISHYVPDSAYGEKCKCGNHASHKVEEVLPYGNGDVYDNEVITDWMTNPFNRHPLTMYVCCKCFGKLMGSYAIESCREYDK